MKPRNDILQGTLTLLVLRSLEGQGALHGYAPPGGARYDRAASETHWERVHDLFRRNLGPARRDPTSDPVA